MSDKRKFREISPDMHLSADEFFRLIPDGLRQAVARIREAKRLGSRPTPATKLLDRSALLSSADRAAILNQVASLVDENLCGRAEMCIQFAELMTRALQYLGLPARSALGVAIYYRDGREVFRWDHAWVRIGLEVIDGNADILRENPMVPSSVDVAPYWGPISAVPCDRHLREVQGKRMPDDIDVDDPWWPELREWLQERFPEARAAQP